MDDDDIEEIIAVNSYTVRKTDGTTEIIEGDEETTQIAKEQIMKRAENLAVAEVAQMFESLQEELLALTLKVEEREEMHAKLYEQLDEYLYYATETLKEEFCESLLELNENNETTLALVDALADFGQISTEQLIRRVSELARSRAINPYGPNPDFGKEISDSAASRNRASIHGAGQRAPATGNLGGGLKENVEVHPNVVRYLDYLNGGYRGGLMNGLTKLAVVPKPEMPQQLAEELREEAVDAISEVCDGMSEKAVAELIEEAGDIQFDGNTEQLMEDLGRKKAEKLRHDRHMAMFDKIAWAQKKGMMFR